MKTITREMLKIYKPYSNKDWMNYKLVRADLTAHHIVKKCDGGRLEFGNVALLMPISHEYLHLIENIDETTYKLINRLFRVFIEQYKEPTKEQREIMEYILRDFESSYKDLTNRNGKPLIKDKYLQR